MRLEARDARLDYERYALAGVLELGCVGGLRRLVVAPSCSTAACPGAPRASFTCCRSGMSQLSLSI
jgi:hypothetical protein